MNFKTAPFWVTPCLVPQAGRLDCGESVKEKAPLGKPQLFISAGQAVDMPLQARCFYLRIISMGYGFLILLFYLFSVFWKADNCSISINNKKLLPHWDINQKGGCCYFYRMPINWLLVVLPRGKKSLGTNAMFYWSSFGVPLQKKEITNQIHLTDATCAHVTEVFTAAQHPRPGRPTWEKQIMLNPCPLLTFHPQSMPFRMSLFFFVFK